MTHFSARLCPCQGNRMSNSTGKGPRNYITRSALRPTAKWTAGIHPRKRNALNTEWTFSCLFTNMIHQFMGQENMAASPPWNFLAHWEHFNISYHELVQKLLALCIPFLVSFSPTALWDHATMSFCGESCI